VLGEEAIKRTRGIGSSGKGAMKDEFETLREGVDLVRRRTGG